MAADLAGGPCTPVAGMQAGSWQEHGQVITVSAASFSNSSTRRREPSAWSCSAQELVTTLKAILQIVQPYPLSALPIWWLGEKQGLPFSPLHETRAHTHTQPCPLLARLGRGSAGCVPGCMASLAASCSPRRAQDLHQGNGGLQWPSVTDLCDQLPRTCKKQEPGNGHWRFPWVQAPQLPGLGSVPSRGVPGASPEHSKGPPGLPCPCLPHACGPGSAFMSGAPLLHQPSLQMAFVSLSSPGNNQSRRQRPAPRCKSCSWVLWGSPREGHRRCNARPIAWELPKREKELEAALLAGAAQ